MKGQIASTWVGFHMATAMFRGPEGWNEAQRSVLSSLQPAGAPWPGCVTDEAVFNRDYAALFWGVDADVYAPLWASACTHQGDILLNETTLEVIRFYHRFGFAPEEMDHNPLDYIGTQLEFLGYLSACAYYEADNGGDASRFLDAQREFIQLFLVDTLQGVQRAVHLHSKGETIPAIVDTICGFVASGCILPYVQLAEGWEEVLSTLPHWPVGQKGMLPPIADAPPLTVRTGGYNNCGGKCIIHLDVQEGCVLRTSTDNSDNAPQIRACVRGRGYRHTFFNAHRLRYPMRRVGKRGEGKFERISWAEAVEEILARWKDIRDRYGPASRYVIYSTGVTSVMRPNKIIQRLLNLDGGFLGSYNSYSDACATYITPYIYGDVYSGNDVEDLENAKLILLWGNNPAETFFGSQRNYYLTKAREKGAKVVVIDPRQSESALAYADEWIGIRPSTDSALADGMAYVIWTEGLCDKAFMDTFCLGFDEEHMPPGIPPGHSYAHYLFGGGDGVPKTPQWASGITGVPVETIVRLAREYAAAKPACLLPGYGLQRTANGEQTVRSLAMLCCLTGNVGIPGGGAGGIGLVRRHAEPSFPVLPSAYHGRIPTFLWSKAVRAGTEMTPREDGLQGVEKLDSNIKMIFSLASNILVNQHANINETTQILRDESQCEFILCSDLFMTASAKYADILLPGASVFEGENITSPWAYGNYVLYNNRARPPLFQSRLEWDWIKEVAHGLGLLEPFVEGKPEMADWLAHFYEGMRKREPELPDFEAFKERGGHVYRDGKVYVAYRKQVEDFANNPFPTPSGKIEIFSTRLYHMNQPDTIPAVPQYVPCPEGPEDALREVYPLQLIGWHTKRRCHSIHDNNPLMEEVEPQQMWIHPHDASDRGISSGDTVKVYNDRGTLHIPAHVTDRIVKGVVAIPQGAWYTPDGDGVDTRGSINVLTATHYPTPVAKANPQHTNLVQVEKL